MFRGLFIITCGGRRRGNKKDLYLSCVDFNKDGNNSESYLAITESA